MAVNAAIERFWDWSDEGRLPVVIDTSPCTYGLRTARASLSPDNASRFDRLRILDAVEFVHDELLPRLRVRPLPSRVALHPVCSLTKMGLAPKFEAAARACTADAVTPLAAGCCGMAGDRGLLFPELGDAATRGEANEVRGGGFAAGYSSSRTCEVNLTRATGLVYRSIVFLVEEATR